MTLGELIATLKTRDPRSGIGVSNPEVILSGIVTLTNIPVIEDWISVAELLEQLEALNNSTVNNYPIDDGTHVWLGLDDIVEITDINIIITQE